MREKPRILTDTDADSWTFEHIPRVLELIFLYA